jgi:outer membrane protein insertion porin family
VDITFDIEKGAPVTIERVDISGNTKTIDKVIRREIKVKEQGLYSATDIKRSVYNLNRLGFFENVEVGDRPGSEENTTILDFNVKEQSTMRQFNLGVGYSSTEKVFFSVSVDWDNFLGRGQNMAVQSYFGDTTTQFSFKFIEPWLFDIPLTAGFSAYKWTKDYDYYDKDSVGGTLSASYPFFSEDMRLFGSYSYDRGTLKNISEEASSTVWALSGANTTSSVTLGVTYDTRNSIIHPTRGQDHLLSVEYAGLGGDIGYTKLSAEAGWYIPLIGPLVGFIHGKAGYIIENPDKWLPDYERYYLGGINSIRGFDWRDVHLYDGDGAAVGGRQMLQANVELQWHIMPSQGVLALAFFDTGQTFDADYYFNRYDTGAVDEDGNAIYHGADRAGFDVGQFRKTAGFGIRWRTGMGPIRIEYGWLLDRREGEESGQFEFSMSTAF